MDPRNEPIYPIASAAWTLALPPSTVSRWVSGGPYSTRNGRRRADPVIELAATRPPTLSFWNLVEVYVLAGIRREHGVPLQKVRKALRYVERELGTERPLIEQEFLTDGVSLFVESYAKLINVSGEGQLALRELLVGSLRRIERDPKGLARRLSPWRKSPNEPREVEIDPLKSFGRRVIAGTAVPTEIIGERFRAGDSIEHLASEYRLKPEQIEVAIRWEHRAASF